MKQTNFTSALKITTSTKQTSTSQTTPAESTSSNKTGESSPVIVRQWQKLHCIPVSLCTRIKVYRVGSAICQSWCFQLQWTGLSSCGTQRTSFHLHQYLLLKVVKNMFTMCNGHLYIHRSLQQSMETAMLIYGISTETLRVQLHTRKHLRVHHQIQLTKNMMRIKHSVVSNGHMMAEDLRLEIQMDLLAYGMLTRNYTILNNLILT